MLIDVFGQKKMNIIACIPIRREDDNQHAQFKTAQQLLNKDMMTKELKSSFSKAKQIVCIWRLQQKELRLEKSKCEVKNARLNHCYLHLREQIVVVADLQSLAAVVCQCIEFGKQLQGRKNTALNLRRIVGQLLEAAHETHEDTAALVQLLMDKTEKYGRAL